MRYLKRGSAARWENGTVVLVAECGTAVEEGDRFSCRPEPGKDLPLPDPARVSRVAAEIVSAVEAPVRIERLVVSEGVAEHRIGTRVWSETHERIHVSLVHGRERALVDLGAFDVEEVREVVSALASCAPGGEAPPRLRLAPRVTAALLPSLATASPAGAEVWQTGGGLDGRGIEIEDVRIAEGRSPNWYRPSYRVRPVRMPLNLRIECAATDVDRPCPVALAVMAPPHGSTVRLLVASGDLVYPCEVRVARIEAAGTARRWYPYGGGAFGSEVLL